MRLGGSMTKVGAVLLLLALASTETAAQPPENEASPPAVPPAPVAEQEGALLMRLTLAVSNWAEKSKAAGLSGWNYPASDPCPANTQNNWTGITCNGNYVQKLELPALGLSGYLPPDLLQLHYLQRLDLSNNQFTGNLPPQWLSSSLTYLDLSFNVLTGPLPVSYGLDKTFPNLSVAKLQGNLLSGPFPYSEWTSVGFAPQAAITLRPGNDGLCGPIPPVDPALFPSIGQNISRVALNSALNNAWNPSGMPMNFSQTFILYEGILSKTGTELDGNGTTEVVITNTLGSCADPCGRIFTVQTNLIDAVLANNVSLGDVLTSNPGISSADAAPGRQLALPCYPTGLRPTVYGSDVAVNRFAGGNERGIDGVAGAEIAGAVVSQFGLGNAGVYYKGSWGDLFGGTGVPALNSSLIQPLYWFVKLDASFKISAVSIMAGDAMESLSVYIGDATTDVAGNQQVAKNLAFAAGQTRIVPANYASGSMIVLYAGFHGQSALSLSRVQVWPSEGNAALHKPLTPLAVPPTNASIITDGYYTTCTDVAGYDLASGVWAWVDLGYSANVAVVGLIVNDTADLSSVQFYVSSIASQDMQTVNGTACFPSDPSQISSSGNTSHVVIQCNLYGRYVGFNLKNTTKMSICMMEAFIDALPAIVPSNTGPSSGTLAGIVVGSVLGGVILALVGTAGVVYFMRRKRRLRVSANGFDPEKQLNGKDFLQHDDSTATGDSSLVGVRRFRNWLGLKIASSPSGDDTPPRITAGETPVVSTDLSKFPDGCDIVDFRDIELVRTIGQGSFGLVWMARYLQTTVAVKILTQDSCRDLELDGSDNLKRKPAEGVPSGAVLAALEREASIMATLRHPNCIQYLGACLHPPALIMEYCSRRSIDTILAAAVLDPSLAKQLDWVRLLSMASDAAKGMLYLHSRSPAIVHRDLKSSNLLVDALWHVKVSDFNLSRALERNKVVSSLQITNPRWLAPEVLRGEHAGMAADVYSFGVVLWELMTWRLPWGHDMNPFAIINNVGNGGTLMIPREEDLPAGPCACYAAYVALVKRCWSIDPDSRPTMDEIAKDLRGMLLQLVQDRINSQSDGT